jgi:hypothetical protein
VCVGHHYKVKGHHSLRAQRCFLAYLLGYSTAARFVYLPAFCNVLYLTGGEFDNKLRFCGTSQDYSGQRWFENTPAFDREYNTKRRNIWLPIYVVVDGE